MIIERTKVLAAYRRARELGASDEEACASVAQSMAIAIEAVCDVVARGGLEGWCCERGEALGQQVCEECAEISAAYSAAMGPEREPERA